MGKSKRKLSSLPTSMNITVSKRRSIVNAAGKTIYLRGILTPLVSKIFDKKEVVDVLGRLYIDSRRKKEDLSRYLLFSSSIHSFNLLSVNAA